MAGHDRAGVATRGQADDVGGVGADEPDAGGGLGLEGIRIEALGGEDPALVVGAAHRVAPDRTVAADDPMAGQDEGHGVMGQSGADGSDGLRVADLGGDPAVRPDLATRDLERLPPDRGLERGRAPEVELNGRPPVAGQSPGDGPGEGRRQGLDAGDGSTRVGSNGVLERIAIAREPDPRDAAAVPGHECLAERRLDRRVPIGEPDGHEGAIADGGRRGRPQGSKLGFDRDHASTSAAANVRPELTWGWVADAGVASAAVEVESSTRRRSSPRETWALTVPSGRPRAAAVSATESPSTCRGPTATRTAGGGSKSRVARSAAASRRTSVTGPLGAASSARSKPSVRSGSSWAAGRRSPGGR